MNDTSWIDPEVGVQYGPGEYFTIAPEWLICSEVSDRAMRVYLVLGLYVNRRSGQAWPTKQELARRLGCAVATVDRGLKELSDAGAITIQARWKSVPDDYDTEPVSYSLVKDDKHTARTSNLYLVHPHRRGDPHPTSEVSPHLTSEPPPHLSSEAQTITKKNQNQIEHTPRAAGADVSAAEGVGGSGPDDPLWSRRLVREETPAGTPRQVLSMLAQRVQTAAVDGASEDVIRRALREWNERPDYGPGMLPSLISGAQRAGPGMPVEPGEHIGSDARFARILRQAVERGEKVHVDDLEWLVTYEEEHGA